MIVIPILPHAARVMRNSDQMTIGKMYPSHCTLWCGRNQNQMMHSNVCQPMTKWYSLMCYRHIHPSVTCMLFELSEWFLDPWKVNKASSDSPVGEFSSILLNSNAEMSITCYLKLKIEIEEMNWVGASAQKSLMFRYWLLIGRPIKCRSENIT